ncbi:DUF4389 domain-containing protein [Streptacidiphilus monticola]|uniref:DUF4389 domain-containing protein n=1 Tax=Streptacidiphilus monticola TaxID=2161674 RepID=A0ABW1GB71_9ACTN
MALWSDPGVPATLPERLPELEIPGPEHQNRLTVLLRLLLLIPHFVILAVLGFIGFFVTVAGWFAALVLGRLPRPIAAYLLGYLRWQTRVEASAMLLADRYPPFAMGERPDHPVRIQVEPTELNRLAVLFRIILMIPAAIIAGLGMAGWWAVAFINWLVVLVLGRMPQPLFQATAAIVRYRMRFDAYTVMLSPAYPKRLFGDGPVPMQGTSGTRPLLLTTGAKVLVVIFLVLGLFSYAGGGTAGGTSDSGTPVDNTVSNV